MRALGERDLKRLGKTGPDTPPPIVYEERTIGTQGPTPRVVQVPQGIDPGWAHTPGRSWLESQTPRPVDPALFRRPPAPADPTPLPEPRRQPRSRMLPEDRPAAYYVETFLKEFAIPGQERARVFEDVTGEPVLINDWLFRRRDGRSKMDKPDRAAYMLLLADTLKLPDEIRESWFQYGEKAVLRRRYIARYLVGDELVPTLVVFETGSNGWWGRTAHVRDSSTALERTARTADDQVIYRRE